MTRSFYAITTIAKKIIFKLKNPLKSHINTYLIIMQRLGKKLSSNLPRGFELFPFFTSVVHLTE